MNNYKNAVFGHIYYPDLVEECMSHILILNKDVDVYISCSRKDTYEKLKKYEDERTIIRMKPNRGRDVSSLLVTFRKDILKYDYFCFIHDKKSIGAVKNEESSDYWRRLYFDNLLGSKENVQKIISKFIKDDKLGVQIPPQPFEKDYLYSYGDEWLSCYSSAEKLGKHLNICMDIENRDIPITLGTVFWARTKALLPLLEYPFEYADFPEEPMPFDGTISHAIERMFGYIAYNEGYKTEVTMTDFWAQDRAQKLEKLTKRLLVQMREYSILKEESNIDIWGDYIQDLFSYCINKNNIYIYGAGFFGQKALNILRRINANVQGFLVSDGFKTDEEYAGYKIYELSDICYDKKRDGIIVAVYNRNNIHNIFFNNLESFGIHDYFIMR